MKIKFSKVLAIVCAVSVAFAGLTAFAAAEGTVITTTTYDAYNGTNAEITVTSQVTGAAGKEVTYYVSNTAGIVYINQKTADATTGETSFTFKAKQGDVLTATAKYGTDAATNAFAGTEFKFAEGVNRITNGTANVASLSKESVTYETFDADGNAILDNGVAVTANGTAYKAIVSGNVIEYGVMVDGVYYPAAGCLEDGTYMVILNGVDVAGKTVYAYAKDANGSTENAVAFAN